MILRRLSANLRAQNWTAIGIEFLIVVVGVFIGTQVANWNQARLEKEATKRMLVQLIPELRAELAFFKNVETYYATTRRYADLAMAGWKNGGGMSDSEFVIAAYQASQISGIGINPDSWSLTFGGEQAISSTSAGLMPVSSSSSRSPASHAASSSSSPPCGICQASAGLSIRAATNTLPSRLSSMMPTPRR